MFVVFILLSFSLNAQTIKGKVTDQNGDGLVGVTITEKGTNNGTISNMSGEYSISVQSASSSLLYSFVGYSLQEVEVAGRSVIDIQMAESAEAIDEVVVVGYGTMKRSDMTGSVVSVNANQIKSTVSSSFDQALTGRAAGVMVSQNSGAPGGGVSVKIRGTSSFSNSEPLYVIDGIPMSGNSQGIGQGFSFGGGGNGQTAINGLSGINPNDILTLEVLKDASATAIYGSRASNGVVLITTKSGKSGKTAINYDGYLGWQTMPSKLDVLNLQEFAKYSNDANLAAGNSLDPYFADPSLLGDGTNWQEEVFQVAPIQNHNITVSGGTDKTRFSTSFGYMGQDGIIIGSDFNRFSGRINLDHDAAKWLKIGVSLNLSNTKERITLNDDVWGITSLALTQSPAVPVRFPDGSWGGPITNDQFLENPVAKAMIREANTNRFKLFGNVFADVKLTKFLTFTTKVGIDMGNRNNYGFLPTYQMGKLVNEQNMGTRSVDQNMFWIVSNYFNFNYNFNKVLDLQVMLGQEAQEASWEGVGGSRQVFISNDIHALNAGDSETAGNSNYKGSSSLQSYYGRAVFNFLDRYLLTSTFRYDGSSKFDEGNKWGFFPSFAVAWKVNNESFLSGVENISNLKLRAGYGAVGNQDIGNYLYGVSLRNYPTKFGTGLLASNYANPNLQWESSYTLNMGIDVAIFNNRIEFVADFYNKFVDNLLMRLPLPLYMGSSGSGAISAPWVNIGKMENKGLELTLNTINTTGNIKWNSGITVTFNRNEVTDVADNVLDGYVQWFDHVTRTDVGNPIGQFYGYVVEGVFQNGEEVVNHATQSNRIDKNSGTWVGDLKYKDLDGNGIINDADRTYIGDPNPNFSYGINNTVTYKGFDFNLLLTGMYGNDVFNYTRRNTESLDGRTNQMASITERAQLGLIDPAGSDNDINNVILLNPGTNMPRISLTDPNNNRRISDRYVEDGSFLRIKSIALGYTLPTEISSKMRISSCRVYFNLQNIYTFSKYKGYDPEVGNYNQDPLLLGIDNGYYPSPTIYSFGANINF